MEDSLVGEKTIALSIAQEIMTTSVDIPNIPENVRKIFDLTRGRASDIDIPDFAKLVESDPGLFTRLLQLANSSYYSEIEEIVTPRAAITRIGLQETVDSVCLHCFQKLLPRFPDIKGFSHGDFWTHSWVCAAAGRRLGHPNLDMGVLPGDLYMAGMFSSVGKLLMAIHFPHDFANCIETALRLNAPLYQVEKDIFGTTDGLVAARVLKGWRFPSVICEAVAYHQTPELAPVEYRLMAGLTQFAYCIAGLSGYGTSGDGYTLELNQTFLGQRPGIRLADPRVQDGLVREILTSIEEKMQPPAKTGSGGGGGGRTPQKDTKNKKGVIAWVKSLL